MPLRIGFDLDGVLADLASAYREIEARLFGPDEVEDEVPETPEAGGDGPDEGDGPAKAGPYDSQAGPHDNASPAEAGHYQALRRKHEIAWHAIQATENFWTTLKPIEEDAVRRIQDTAARHRWDVFFITQRPDTAGDTAQRQTQRWLAAHGFDLPSVIAVRGPRGKVAAALELDYLVDDTPKNCVDVLADSKTRPILILRQADRAGDASARRLGIGVARSVGDALAILEQAQAVRNNPTLFERLARAVGWK